MWVTKFQLWISRKNYPQLEFINVYKQFIHISTVYNLEIV
jgi:hypothetical protein